MTKVAILTIPSKNGEVSYSAVAGDKRTAGKTAGQALDALNAQLNNEDNTLIIVQNQRPDKFFSATQQQRLAELMEKWRGARDKNTELSIEEQSELNTLVETELLASANRTTSLINELRE